MAMTYTTLVADKSTPGSIKAWANYSKLDSETILADAQALIYQTLRVREMKATAELSMAVGDSSKALPTGFLDPCPPLSDKLNQRYEHVTLEQLMAARIYDEAPTLISAQPCRFAIDGTTLQFESKFDTATTLVLVHYATPTALGSGNPSNFLTDRYPHILRTACLAYAADFMDNDARYQRYASRLIGQIELTNAESDLSLRGAILSP
mgnify:CR=1 FL=1